MSLNIFEAILVPNLFSRFTRLVQSKGQIFKRIQAHKSGPFDFEGIKFAQELSSPHLGQALIIHVALYSYLFHALAYFNFVICND